MKTLFLMRHAKSSWEDRALDDFARPLNERGRRAAPLMGKYLLDKNMLPELIVSSPALRAAETARMLATAAKYKNKIEYDACIYEANVATLLKIIGELDENINSAMLVGHNPGMENALAHLTNEARHMPTAGLAHISFDIHHWADIAAGAGRLLNFTVPKELNDK